MARLEPGFIHRSVVEKVWTDLRPGSILPANTISKTMRLSIYSLFSAFFLGLITAPLLLSQDRLQPTLKDVAYAGDDPAQILDFYQAASETSTPLIVFIHGGGWRAGSKNAVPAYLLRAVQEGWASVVSLEYRFTDVEIHRAQVNDCMRAIQFVRSQAAEWNIDPTRVGVTGGSAGAHLSLWIALHDDVAEPGNDDPVERESSRVSCAVGFAGPTDWSLLSEIDHKHPAYRQLLGYDPGFPAEEMSGLLKTDVSPITFASKDDPPTLIIHGDADSVVPIEHAIRLRSALEKVGADSELFVVEGGEHNVAGGGGADAAARATEFFKEHLLGKAPAE